MRPGRRQTASSHPVQPVTGGGIRTLSRHGGALTGAGAGQPVRRLPSVLVSRRREIVMAATDRGHAVITEVGELYLCGQCASRHWRALSAQGWTFWPLGVHALAPQASAASRGDPVQDAA
jgi:hypothetical protein